MVQMKASSLPDLSGQPRTVRNDQKPWTHWNNVSQTFLFLLICFAVWRVPCLWAALEGDSCRPGHPPSRPYSWKFAFEVYVEPNLRQRPRDDGPRLWHRALYMGAANTDRQTRNPTDWKLIEMFLFLKFSVFALFDTGWGFWSISTPDSGSTQQTVPVTPLES